MKPQGLASATRGVLATWNSWGGILCIPISCIENWNFSCQRKLISSFFYFILEFCPQWEPSIWMLEFVCSHAHGLRTQATRQKGRTFKPKANLHCGILESGPWLNSATTKTQPIGHLKSKCIKKGCQQKHGSLREEKMKQIKINSHLINHQISY